MRLLCCQMLTLEKQYHQQLICYVFATDTETRVSQVLTLPSVRWFAKPGEMKDKRVFESALL
jgi:hypothetical protein